jgi:hypothetical protein
VNTLIRMPVFPAPMNPIQDKNTVSKVILEGQNRNTDATNKRILEFSVLLLDRSTLDRLLRHA